MGVLQELVRAFWDGFNNGTGKAKEEQKAGDEYGTPAEEYRQKDMTVEREWLYPAGLPTFETLAGEGHADPRGLVYAILLFNMERKRPFSDEDISYLDFGKKSTAYSALRKSGLIAPLEPCEEMAELYTREEMEKLAEEHGVSKSGNKHTLAKKLLNGGVKIDRRKHRGRLFRLTEKGKNVILEYRADEEAAIRCAAMSLRNLNYGGAVAAYRDFDKKWGFAHTSGKKHTIFAHYDIPRCRFRFIETYPMWELENTRNFKDTLRACLIAGLMRGCEDRLALRYNVESLCNETIRCPGLTGLFDYEKEVLWKIQEQINHDAGSALEYYISHVLYLSRKEVRGY